jgi:hypothetical protein
MDVNHVSRREHAIITRFITTLLICLLALPTGATAQSGDASWLESLDGLDLAIGRSWMAPLEFETESATTDFNEEGTPVSQVVTRSTPESTPVRTEEIRTLTLSALIYQFDSLEHASDGMQQMHAAQMDQWERDPRSPDMEAFDTGGLGDDAVGAEGIYTSDGMPGTVSELAIVMLFVQDDTTVYQVFGQFLPGDHTEIATDVVRDMLAAEASDEEPVFDMDGGSTGGLWEKLNAVNLAMPEGSTVFDLEIYPVSDDAVQGDSVMVPEIDLNNLGDVPGIVGSWYIAYAPATSGTPAATPVTNTTGAFSIELWVMEFEDPTHASAALFSLNATLTEPLGIVGSEGSSFSDADGNAGMTLVNTGFVRDSALHAYHNGGIAFGQGTTLYAARVYTRDLAPTPVAKNLVMHLRGIPPGTSEAADTELVPSNDPWDYFPQAGDEMLYGLASVIVRHDSPLGPPATPVG